MIRGFKNIAEKYNYVIISLKIKNMVKKYICDKIYCQL